MIQGDNNNDSDSLTAIAYTSFGIFILDLMTYIVGLYLICRLKVNLDRTLLLALIVTGIAIVLKMAYNVLLFSTGASRKSNLPEIVEIILWNT